VFARRRFSLAACVALPAFVTCVALVPHTGAGAAVAVATAGTPHGRPFTPHTPTTAVHTDFMVEINRKGQVTRVRSGKSCPDLAFNAMTYGNALQAFIRTADGRAIPGVYRLSYDFDPRTKLVHRSVALVRVGGVDPNRQSAVDEMAAIARRHHGAEPAAPQPAPSSSPLPSFHDITGHHH